MQSSTEGTQLKSLSSNECSKQENNKEFLDLAIKENARELAEGISKAFKDNRTNTVVMRKEDLAEVVTHAYTAGANAVVRYYEGP